jgi:hypothetical protein
MNLKIDTAVIYSNDEILDVVHGKAEGLFRTLTDHYSWETILESLYESETVLKNLEELEDAQSSGKLDSCSYIVKIFRGKTYKY